MPTDAPSYTLAYGKLRGLAMMYRIYLKAEDADPRALLHALLNDMDRIIREADEEMRVKDAR